MAFVQTARVVVFLLLTWCSSKSPRLRCFKWYRE